MIAGRAKGAISAVPATRTKQVTISGTPSGSMIELQNGTWIPVTFAGVVVDGLGPFIETDNLSVFTVQEDGYYGLEFSCYMPDGGSSPATGFGTGWSGTGSGGIYINTNRYGNEGVQAFGPTGSPGSYFMDTGQLKRYLYRGDTISCWVSGGGTGHGPWVYAPTLTLTKFRS